jgi:hypothetical protein
LLLECNAYPCDTDEMREPVASPLADPAKGHCDIECPGITPENGAGCQPKRLTWVVLLFEGKVESAMRKLHEGKLFK